MRREDHADGGTHLHVFADFKRTFRSRQTSILAVDGQPPIISRSKGTPDKGYDYATIQSIVNRILGFGTQTVSSGISLSAVVDKVLNGDYGNNPGRADKLRAEGYDPNTVQAAVNARLGVAGAAPVGGEIVKGSKVQVTNPVDVNGTKLAVSGTYDVIEVNGDRVVIGKGSTVTAAVQRANLK